MNQQNKVSSQFVQDTIPQSVDNECARCQMLEVENERLNWLVVNMMAPVYEIKELDNATKNSA